MKKAECEAAIRMLCRQWAVERGVCPTSEETPSFDDFKAWLNVKGYSIWLSFRSKQRDVEVECWFTEEIMLMQMSLNA